MKKRQKRNHTGISDGSSRDLILYEDDYGEDDLDTEEFEEEDAGLPDQAPSRNEGEDSQDLEYVDMDSLLNEEAESPRRTGQSQNTASLHTSRNNASGSNTEKRRKNNRQMEKSFVASHSDHNQRKARRKMQDNPVRDNDKESWPERVHNPAFWVHIILPAAIIIIALAAFIRYQLWARGTSIEIDAGNESRFNVEVNDEMVLLPESRLAGHEEDGVTTILCLGDAPFSDDTTQSGLAGQIEVLANGSAGSTSADGSGSAESSSASGSSNPVETINASFPDSQVACFNTSYQTDTQHDMEDTFNLFYVAYAISIGNYDTMETVASLHADEPQYAAAVENLKNTDFSKVDIIAIMYDGIDYVNQSPAYNPDLPVSEQINTYQGALGNTFSILQEKYPYIRIVFLSPTYMLLEDSEGNYQDARTENIGNGTLAQYWQYGMDICGDNGVSFLDNYYGSVNDSNYTQYLSDNIHLNNAGRTKVADHFVYKVIQNQYAEYDVSSLQVADGSGTS